MRFLILHIGFVPPTPVEMAAWQAWFEQVAPQTVDRGHLPGGHAWKSDGDVRDLTLDPTALTGFTLIEAESLEEATRLARACPVVTETRVYEVR